MPVELPNRTITITKIMPPIKGRKGSCLILLNIFDNILCKPENKKAANPKNTPASIAHAIFFRVIKFSKLIPEK